MYTWSVGALDNPADVENYVQLFDEERLGGEFKTGDRIPAGAVIATDFGNGESEIWQEFPVRPVVHYRSYGLFETTGEYVAVHPGACMMIAQ